MKIALFNEADSRSIDLRILFLWLYACLITFGILHHAPSNDEADPWVMARDTNFYDFIHFFGYCGHPPLWYVTLLPFARAGLPFETIGVINAFFAMMVAWLVLFRSPFSLWFSVIFLFSFLMSWQYAVVARGYMLMVLLLFLIAALYPARLKSPLRYGLLLALLFNSEGFSIIPAAVMAVFFTLECLSRPGGLKRYWPAIAVIAAGAAITLISLWPPDDIRDRFRGIHYHPFYFIDGITKAFLTLYEGWQPYVPGFAQEMPYHILWLSLPAIAALLLTAAYVRHTRWVVLFLAWLGWFYFLLTYKGVDPSYYRAGVLIPFTLWTLWLYRSTTLGLIPSRCDREVSHCLAVCLALIFLFADYRAAVDYPTKVTVTYNGGKDMAAFIKNSGYDHDFIASMASSATSVSAYLPDTAFWMVIQNRFAGYITWDRSFDRARAREHHLAPALVKYAASHDNTLVLSSFPLRPPAGVRLQLLHYSPGELRPYYLYSIQVSNRYSPRWVE